MTGSLTIASAGREWKFSARMKFASFLTPLFSLALFGAIAIAQESAPQEEARPAREEMMAQMQKIEADLH